MCTHLVLPNAELLLKRPVEGPVQLLQGYCPFNLVKHVVVVVIGATQECVSSQTLLHFSPMKRIKLGRVATRLDLIQKPHHS